MKAQKQYIDKSLLGLGYTDRGLKHTKYIFRIDYSTWIDAKKKCVAYAYLEYENHQPYLTQSQLDEWVNKSEKELQIEHNANNIFIQIISINAFIKEII